jgi:hypothetical protein
MKLNPRAKFDGETPAGGSGLELERFLPYRLSVLTNRISTAIARV